jgi:hypothetical protein
MLWQCGGFEMLRQYREIWNRLSVLETDLSKACFERDQLIETFDQTLGGLRLPMRLRRRSGGLLAWRNIAKRGREQRDLDLSQYQNDLVHLPQSIRSALLGIEKQRIFINLNLSLLQHESKQLKQAIKKIESNTTILEPMAS